MPERDFFYHVLLALHPETFEDLLEQASKSRQPKNNANLQDEQWAMNIQPEWMERLLEYDYTSSKYIVTFLIFNLIAKKGRGLSSLLISATGRNRAPKRRKMNDGNAERVEEEHENNLINEVIGDSSF